jgi:hypothetical protein
MARNAFIAVLSVVLGCGPPFEAEGRCESGLVAIIFHTEGSPDCAYLAAVEAAALDEIRDAGIASPWEEVEALRGVVVWVRATTAPFPCGNVTRAWGCYYPDSQWIVLTVDCSSLLHEMLHRLEHARGGPPQSHEGWDTRGARVDAPTIIIREGPVRVGSWWHVASRFAQGWSGEANARHGRSNIHRRSCDNGYR